MRNLAEVKSATEQNKTFLTHPTVSEKVLE